MDRHLRHPDRGDVVHALRNLLTSVNVALFLLKTRPLDADTRRLVDVLGRHVAGMEVALAEADAEVPRLRPRLELDAG